MTDSNYAIGESFPVQFAWKLPDGDYLRVVFQATVIDLVPGSDKYVVRLSQLLAGRQETEDGRMRPKEELSKIYWEMVGKLTGRKITVAYEADDGRALHLRLATLTGEHNFFRRFEEAEDALGRQLKLLKKPPP
jgi:hypothetical protein